MSFINIFNDLTFEKNPIHNKGVHKQSSKYAFVSTETLQSFISESFPKLTLEKEVVNRVRKIEHLGYQKHRLVYTMESTEIGDKIQLVITNSHRGDSGVIIQLGYFRLICANGLMVGKDIFKRSIRHTGKDNIYMKIYDTIKGAYAAMVKLKNARETLMNTTLTETRKVAMVNALFAVREIKDSRKQEIIKRFLKPKREADKADNLWAYFNVIQEAAIRGTTGLRKVSSIQTQTQLNEELFSAAMAIAAV